MNNAALQTLLAEMATLPDFGYLDSITATTRGAFGNTPLHVAAIRGDVAAIKILLDAGADINVHSEHGYTPLHEAVEQGHISAVRALLERGTDRQLRTDEGITPLDIARLGTDHELQNLL